MGGGSLPDAKLVVVGSGGTESGGSEGKGFYTINGNSFIQVTEPSFDQAPFPHNGIGFNTTDDINEPKWAVVGDPIGQSIDSSNTGFYSSNGIDWDVIQDVSFFWNDSGDNGYGWNSIASDGSKTWVAVGRTPAFTGLSITTSSIDSSNSWISFDDIGDGVPNRIYLFNTIDYYDEHWICVGQRNDDETGGINLGGVWVSNTTNPIGVWAFQNDTSNQYYEYKGVGYDTSGRWMVVGQDNSGQNNGKAFYSNQKITNPFDSSWTQIDNSLVDASNTTWSDADYSPDHNRWVIVGSDNSSFPTKGKIVYNDSGDLSTWNSADTTTDPDLSGFLFASSVVWDNNFNKFFAAGSITNSSFTTNGVILESSDGITWQKSGSTYDDISGLGFLGIASSSPNL